MSLSISTTCCIVVTRENLVQIPGCKYTLPPLKHFSTKRDSIWIKNCIKISTFWTRQDGHYFADDISNSFLKRKLHFDQNFTVLCPWWSNWQHPCIGSDQNLASIRRQSIIWKKCWHIWRRIYASPSFSDLKLPFLWTHITHIPRIWTLVPSHLEKVGSNLVWYFGSLWTFQVHDAIIGICLTKLFYFPLPD